ncbi:glycosyltransferase [Crocinitomix sp.]|nr:glycosyltransferase [Crocinitomix sp.]
MTKNKIIPIVVPARNESDKIIATIHSIRNSAKYANIEAKIVIVDDGSKDNTPELAEKEGCVVIRLKDRGYSALGKPELADTHNAGFDYIKQNLSDYNYLMVFGADTTCAENYISLLIQEMDNNKSLAMCAGMIEGYKTNKTAVRGSGRIIRKTFWDLLDNRLKNIYYSWESYPIVFANANGWKTQTIYHAHMQTSRPPLKGVDWYRYGIGAKENGTIFPYLILRAARAFFKISPRQAFQLIRGYFSEIENPYPEELRAYTRKYQKNRIKKFLFNPFKK